MIADMASRQSAELVSYSGEISTQPIDERQDMRFVAQVFARTSLPYRQPRAGTQAWVRRNGAWTLTVQPGMTNDAAGNPVSIGFPYGTMPRLLSMWMSTEAARTRQRTLVLGDNLHDFMDRVGIKKKSGGPRGTITTLRDQAEKLFLSTVSVRFEGDPDRQVGSRVSVVTNYSLWWSKDAAGDDTLMPSTVTLTQEFFEECTNYPVPVDMATIQKLRGSAMRIDIYIWLTHRMSYLKNPSLVPWDALQLQFGSNVNSGRQGARKFRLDFTENLNKVLAVYDKASARATDQGVFLLPGATDIRPSQSRELRSLESEWRSARQDQLF